MVTPDAGTTTADAGTTTADAAGPPPDTTPPTLNITWPNDGDTISGVITVTAEANDANGVKMVLLFMDNEHIGSDYHAPFEFLWDTSTFSEGAHSLTARAFDPAGNPAVDDDTTVTIAAASPDTTEPEEQRVFLGKRRWGCTASPAPADLAAALIAFLAFAFLVNHRRRR